MFINKSESDNIKMLIMFYIKGIDGITQTFKTPNFILSLSFSLLFSFSDLFSRSFLFLSVSGTDSFSRLLLDELYL